MRWVEADVAQQRLITGTVAKFGFTLPASSIMRTSTTDSAERMSRALPSGRQAPCISRSVAWWIAPSAAASATALLRRLAASLVAVRPEAVTAVPSRASKPSVQRTMSSANPWLVPPHLRSSRREAGRLDRAIRSAEGFAARPGRPRH